MPRRSRRKLLRLSNKWSGYLTGLAFTGAGHQFLDGFPGRFAVVQDGVHLFGDGHFDIAGLGQANGGGGGEDSFGDHAVHGVDDSGQLSSATEFDSDAAVSGQATGAREHQVAEAGQTGHGFGASSAGPYQPSHLRPAPRDRGG